MAHAFETDRLVCRELTIEDVSDAYLGWLQDPQINRYLETRFSEQTLDSIRAFVAEKLASENDFQFGIFAGDRHIGNIKLGPINWRHNIADVGYLIGDKTAWGHGYASEAIRGASGYAFEAFSLCKLSAGLYAWNTGSARALEKAGFIREGVRRDHLHLEGRRVDLWEYGLRRADWITL